MQQKPVVFIPLILTFLGFVGFHVVAFSCDTFKMRSSELIVPEAADEYDWVTTIGFWSAEEPSRRGCVDFSAMDVIFEDDYWFQAGQRIAMGGAFLAWFVLGVMALATVRRIPSPRLFQGGLSALMFVMASLSLLVMVALASKHLETFEVGTGVKVGIGAAVMWVLAGITVLFSFHDLDDPFVVTEVANDIA